MKKAKLLFSAIVSLLLVAVMAFTVTACGKKDKNGATIAPDVPDKSASELGITDSSGEQLALQYIEIVNEGRTVFSLGENFVADGLTVRAILLNPEKQATIEDIEGNLEYKNLNPGDYTVDSGEYNPNKVGTYNIYVSYTFGGVTRIADYKVSISSVTPEIGGIVAKLADGKSDTYSLTSSSPTVVIPKDTVAVYSVEEDAEGKAVLSSEPLAAEEYDAQLYLGAKKIANNEAEENGTYSLVVSLVADATKQDYIPVYVINPVKSIEVDYSVGMYEQGQSMKDLMTHTWQFTLTYENGVTKTIKGNDPGIKITLDTNTIAENQTANVTYTEKDGQGGEHTVTCTVTYTITEFKGEPVNYSVTYDVDSPDGGSNFMWTTKWDGEEDLEGFVDFDASALSTGKAGSKTTADESVSVEYSYEFKADKNLLITVNEAAQNVVIKYYVSHGTVGADNRTAMVVKDGQTVAEVTPLPADDQSSPNLEVMTVNASAGTYILTTNNTTMRLYMVEISYIATPGTAVVDQSIKYRPEVGQTQAGEILAETNTFRASFDACGGATYEIQASNKGLKTDTNTKLPNRLKLTGAIEVMDTEVLNGIKIETYSACTITFYVRSANDSEMGIFQGYTFNQGVLTPVTAGLENNYNYDTDGYVYVITFEIEEGTYYFGANNAKGVGIYGFDVKFN